MPSNCLSLIFCDLLVLAAVLASTCHAQFDISSSMSTVNRAEDINVSIPPATADLQVYALPVGQGDCTVIQCPNGNIVVLDCGSSGGNRATPNQIENFLGAQIDQVVAIIITHPDRDHFNYLYQINWNTTNINQVIIGGTLQNYNRPTSPQFVNIYNWLVNFNNMGKLYTVSNGQSCIGNCAVPLGTNFCNNQNIRFNVLAANVGTTSNQKSIVVKAVVSQFSMLLPGDMEGPAATNIANTLGAQLQSVVYKIAHHGASTLANSLTWLTPIRPRMAFASSAYNFGNCRHPRCLTIQRIQNFQTIVQATSHDFYCGNGPGVNPTQYNTFNDSMFETSPTPTVICMLTYLSSNQGSYSCFQLLQLSDGVGDDECPQPEDLEEEEGGGGGALSIVASYITLIMSLLYFIFTV